MRYAQSRGVAFFFSGKEALEVVVKKKKKFPSAAEL